MIPAQPHPAYWRRLQTPLLPFLLLTTLGCSNTNTTITFDAQSIDDDEAIAIATDRHRLREGKPLEYHDDEASLRQHEAEYEFRQRLHEPDPEAAAKERQYQKTEAAARQWEQYNQPE